MKYIRNRILLFKIGDKVRKKLYLLISIIVMFFLLTPNLSQHHSFLIDFISKNTIENQNQLIHSPIRDISENNFSDNYNNIFSIESVNEPILANLSLRDIYIYHKNATKVIAIDSGNGKSIIVFANNSLYFYNYSRSYAIDFLDYDYGYIGSSEKLVVLSNGSLEIFNSSGEILASFKVDLFWRNVSLVGENIIIWRGNDSYLEMYNASGSLIMNGSIIYLKDLSGASIIHDGEITIRDILYYSSSIVMIIQYTQSGTVIDAIAKLEYQLGINRYLTAIVIDNEPPMSIYNYTFGEWRSTKSIFVLLKNKTKGYEIRIYAGLNGLNYSILINVSLSQLIINNIDVDTVNDWNGDNISEVIISNSTHIGAIISNSTERVKELNNLGLEACNSTLFSVYNSSSILIMNETIDLIQKYDTSYGSIRDVFNLTIDLIAITDKGNLISINPRTNYYLEQKITTFNYKGYSYSLNCFSTYTGYEVFANWVNETRYILRFTSSEIERTQITNNSLTVFLSNQTVLIYSKNKNLIYRSNSQYVELATAMPDASQVYLALNNGTLIENISGRRLALSNVKPFFLDIFNDQLVYIVSGVLSGPIINVTLITINPVTLSIYKTFTVLLDIGGSPFNTLESYGISIAINYVNQNNIPDMAIGVYGEVSGFSGAIFRNGLNICVIEDLGYFTYKYSAQKEQASSSINYRYSLYPFNNSFLFVNSSSSIFYLLEGNGSIRKLGFAGERALAAANDALFTNESIKIFYNNYFAYNITVEQNVTIAFSSLKDGSLLTEFVDLFSVERVRQLSGIEDYYAPLLNNIRSPKIISDSTLISGSKDVLFDLTFSDDRWLKNYSISINAEFNKTGYLEGEQSNVIEVVSTNLVDGTYPLEIIIYDLAGRKSTYLYDLIIDTTPPTIEVNYRSIYNSSSITFTMNVSDLNYDYTDIYLDGQYYTKSIQANVTVDLAGLLQGKHTVRLVSFDKANNYFEKQFSFIVDLEKPEIVVLSPLNESYTNTQSVYISLNVTDNYNLSSLSITINNELLFNKKLNSSQVLLNESIELAVGQNIITIEAIDNASLKSIVKFTIYLDTEDPIIRGDTTFINSTYIELSIVASDNLKLSNITVYLDGDILDIYEESHIVINLNLEEGIHNITIYAIDKAGNKAQKQIELIIDVTLPEMNIIQPANSTILNASEIEINVTVQDNIGVKCVLIYVDDEMALNRSVNEIYYRFNLSDGTHNITIVSIDLVGNKAIAYLEITIDTTPPTVAIISPENNSVVNESEVTIQISYLDNIGISRIILIVNGSVVYNTTNLINEFNIQLGLEGKYVIEVIVYDVAGNSDIDQVTIVYESFKGNQTGANSFLEMGSAIILGMIGSTLGFLIVFSKRKVIARR